MEQKIELQHPGGKKGISMEKDRYEIVKEALIRCLKSNHEITHDELFEYVSNDLGNQKIKFPGSIQWYLEWVKLDCEAKKLIIRTSNKSPIKYKLSIS